MYSELSDALRETFRKNKELLKTPEKFIEKARSSFSGNSSVSEKTYTTLKHALENRLIFESLLIIDKAEPYFYKASLVDKIYLHSFLRILKDNLGMDYQQAMFTVIPNLFHILGLCVNPESENDKILVTM